MESKTNSIHAGTRQRTEGFAKKLTRPAGDKRMVVSLVPWNNNCIHIQSYIHYERKLCRAPIYSATIDQGKNEITPKFAVIWIYWLYNFSKWYAQFHATVITIVNAQLKGRDTLKEIIKAPKCEFLENTFLRKNSQRGLGLSSYFLKREDALNWKLLLLEHPKIKSY